MIYICKPSKVRIYVNTAKKTIAQIKAETGCDAIINAGLFNLSAFTPVSHLKVDGKVLSSNQWRFYGYGWDADGFPTLTVDYSGLDNYVCCLCLVREGKAETLSYTSDLGGSRQRTAMGTFADGRLWLYADKTGKTPEQLQTIALAAGVRDAVMLDGGGSTQGIFPDGAVESARKVHNLICVWSEEAKAAEKTPVFKIALSAGHGINTYGKHCLKSLDPNETKEWWLNDRICDRVEALLKDYDGYELLRLDDSDDGKENVALATRVNNANNWGADFYLSVHHNAGINGGSGGGIVAYVCKGVGEDTTVWQRELYEALIAKTGLKGNRATPLAVSNLYVLVYTKMPAVLLELGFMDSSTDVPIILTDDYAQKCAEAIVEVLVKRGGLTKKVTEDKPAEVKIDGAASGPNAAYNRIWTVNASLGLQLRTGASAKKTSLGLMPNGSKVRCYGYYTKTDGTVWLLVVVQSGKQRGKTGFCSMDYLK